MRFVWSRASCGWCRRIVHLYSDDGTIEAGITVDRTPPRSPATARWYTLYRPSSAPSIPHDCPNPACHRPATRCLPTGEVVATGWLTDTWTMSTGPFPIEARTDPRCPRPAKPTTLELINQVRATLRATHPDMAAAADAHHGRHHRRAGRG